MKYLPELPKELQHKGYELSESSSSYVVQALNEKFVYHKENIPTKETEEENKIFWDSFHYRMRKFLFKIIRSAFIDWEFAIIDHCKDISRYNAIEDAKEKISEKYRDNRDFLVFMVVAVHEEMSTDYRLMGCAPLLDVTKNIVPNVYTLYDIGRFVDDINGDFVKTLGQVSQYEWVKTLYNDPHKEHIANTLNYLMGSKFSNRRWKLISILAYLRVISMENKELLPTDNKELSSVMTVMKNDFASAIGVASKYEIQVCPRYLGISDKYHPNTCDDAKISCDQCWKEELGE